MTKNTSSKQRYKKKKSLFERIVFLFLIAVLLFSGYQLASNLLEGHQINLEDEDLRTRFVTQGDTVDDFTVDFQALTAENSDTVAFLRIPGTTIQYPIVQRPGDNNYYLRRNFAGSYSISGSIYLDSDNNPNLTDPVSFVYGHNISTTLTFGKRAFFTTLADFTDPDHFASHRNIEVYTKSGKKKTYQTLTLLKVNESTPLYQTSFPDATSIDRWISTLQQEAPNIDQELHNTDKFLVLATCGEAENATPERFLLIAVED